MTEVIDIFVSAVFIGCGISVGIAMLLIQKLLTSLWKIYKLRKFITGFYVSVPWLPLLFGGIFGSLSFWPVPELFVDSSYSKLLMIFLGISSGMFYERIWKGFRQGMETRGVNLELDLPPKEQLKWRK